MGTRNIYSLILLIQVLNITFKLCTCQVVYSCQEVTHKGYNYGNLIGLISINVPPNFGNTLQIVVETGVPGPLLYNDGNLAAIDERQTYGRIVLKYKPPSSVPSNILRIFINSYLYCSSPHLSGLYPGTITFSGQIQSDSFIDRNVNINRRIGNDISNYFEGVQRQREHFIRRINFSFGTTRQPPPYIGDNYPRYQTSSSTTPPPERTTLKPSPSPPPPVDNIKPILSPLVNNLPDNCGSLTQNMMKKLYTPTVIKGLPVIPHSYPWLVFLKNENEGSCGATLVADNFVITAAHCVENSTKVSLQFGRHNLIENENGTERRTSDKIFMHPNYKDAHADIAIVSFPPIKFSEKIWPICIWRFDPEVEAPDGRVVGWGRYRNNDGPPSIVPKSSQLTKKDCETNLSLTYDNFCAAGHDMSVTCHGDSGGGFYVVRDTTWFLQGVISHSAGHMYSCYPTAIFVDIANYLDWISYITKKL